MPRVRGLGSSILATPKIKLAAFKLKSCAILKFQAILIVPNNFLILFQLPYWETVCCCMSKIIRGNIDFHLIVKTWVLPHRLKQKIQFQFKHNNSKKKAYFEKLKKKINIIQIKVIK